MIIDPQVFGAWLGTAALAVVAAWQKRRADIKALENKHMEDTKASTSQSLSENCQTLLKAREELITRLETTLKDYQKQFDREHVEFNEAREYWHNKAKEDMAALMKLTEENLQLRARTDLTPIMAQLNDQSEANQKISATMKDVAQTLALVAERLNISSINRQ